MGCLTKHPVVVLAITTTSQLHTLAPLPTRTCTLKVNAYTSGGWLHLIFINSRLILRYPLLYLQVPQTTDVNTVSSIATHLLHTFCSIGKVTVVLSLAVPKLALNRGAFQYRETPSACMKKHGSQPPLGNTNLYVQCMCAMRCESCKKNVIKSLVDIFRPQSRFHTTGWQEWRKFQI